MRISVAVLSFGVCLAVASCGRSDNGKTVVYSNGNGTVTASQNGDQEHVVVHSATGAATMDYSANGMTHMTMPDFAPLYPGAKVTSSLNESAATGGGALVVFTTTSSPSDVIAYYKQKATAAGLTPTLDMTAGDTMTFIANTPNSVTTANKKALQVSASKSSDVTQVSMTFTTGKQ
jgi:hypothetical protein